jgi:hypothetical protein
LPLRSDDPIALRYDEQNFSVGYYADKLSLPGISDLPSSTALRLQSRGELGVQGFVGFMPLGSKAVQITPDGTRFYRLGEAVQPGSEQVVVWVGAEEVRLERLRDYALDYPSGNIILARALFSTDPNFQPVRLHVTYAPEGNPRELGYGLGLRYKSSGFSAGVGVARVPGSDWRYGAEVGYEGGGLNIRTAYLYSQKGRYVLELAYKGSELNANANFALEDRVQGQARIAYSLSSQDQLSLEHQAAAQNRTGLVYQRRLDERFSVGGGLGYTWEEGALNALLRLGYQEGPIKTELTHSQPFSLLSKAQTQLRASYAVDANLSLEADLTNVWGNDLLGVVGIKQQLGGANLSASYQLPSASGEGNRARFGLEAPIPIAERLSLGLSAGYERNLSTGRDQSAFGVALRYNSKELNATLGTEMAFSTQTKLVFRAGATGVLDTEQTLSFDATYQLLPAAEGQFTVAYALRAREVQLLTYHRLNSSSKGSLEGALALAYQPDTRFQLRPSLAYRLPLADATGTTFQLGLGANYYLNDRLGFGGAIYYQFQPGTSTGALGYSLEGSFKIMDELWFNLGYTFGGFTGITPDTYPGLYLRFDFLSGGDGR